MAIDVSYYTATGEVYSAATKDTKAFYLVDNGDGTKDLYLGTLKLSNAADLATAVSNIATNAADIATINATLTKLENTEETTGSIRSIIKSYFDDLTAANVPIADEGGNFTATDVEGALAELADASAGGTASKTIWLNPNETVTNGYLKTYGIYQGANSFSAAENPATLIGKIDIPKDFVLKSGKLVTVTSGTDSDGDTTSVADGKYIKLVVNVTEGSATDSVIYINIADLVDVYTGSGDAVEAPTTGITISVDSNNVISATIQTLDGSKLDAGSVAKAKLAITVQNSLDLADSAIQQEDMVASNVEYKAAVPESSEGAGDGSAAVSVAQALTALEAAVGEGGSVASQIESAIGALDASVSASLGAGDTDEYAVATLGGVVEADGKLTSVTSVAADRAGAATAVKEAITGTASDTATDLTLNGLNAKIGDEVDTLSAEIDALDNKIGVVPQSSTTHEDQSVVEYIQEQVGSGVGNLNGTATIATKSTVDNVVTLKAGIVETNGIISNNTDNDIVLAKVASTGAGNDINLNDAGNYFAVKNVESALQSIAEHLTWRELTAN